MEEVRIREGYFLKLTESEGGDLGFNTRDIYFYDNGDYIISNKIKTSILGWNTENSIYQVESNVIDSLKNYLYIEEDVFGTTYPYYMMFDVSYKVEVKKDEEIILIENNLDIYNYILKLCNLK